MALDQKIYELRLQKLKEIETLGQPAYPHKYETTHTIPQIVAEYSAKSAEQLANPKVEVRVAGRIVALLRARGRVSLRAAATAADVPLDRAAALVLDLCGDGLCVAGPAARAGRPGGSVRLP